MDNFDDFSDGLVDSEPYKLKAEKSYFYHFISNTYNGRSRTVCKELSKCCAQQFIQSECLIQLSPINKLIAENKKKMNQNTIHSVPKSINCNRLKRKFTYQQKKTIKNRLQKQLPQNNKNNCRSPTNQEILLTTEEEYVKNKCSKNKRNRSECSTERRRSRRLSNLPPISIKEGIIEDGEELCVSFNKRSFSLINEIGNYSDYSPQEKNSFEVSGTSFSLERSTTELNQTYDRVNELNDKDNQVNKKTSHVVTPFVLTPIHCKYTESYLAQTNNCNSIYTYDDTNTNLGCSENKINDCDPIKNSDTRENLFNTKAESMNFEQANAYHYTNTNIIPPKNHLVQTNDCQIIENSITTKHPLDQDVLKQTDNDTNSIFTYAENKINDGYLTENSIVTENVLCPKTKTFDSEQFCSYDNEERIHDVVEPSNCFAPMILECWNFKTLENQVRSTKKNESEITETKESLYETLKYSEMKTAQRSLISHSDRYELEEIQSHTYNDFSSMLLSETRETEKKSSNKLYSEINEMEVTMPPHLSYSKMCELDRLSLPEKYETKKVDRLFQLNTYSKITEVEKLPSPLETYSNVFETKEEASQQETYFNNTETDTFSLPETLSRNVINKLTLQEENSDLDSILLPNKTLEKTVKDKIDLLDKCPKNISMSESNIPKKYFEMTIQEKKLYREKLNFVTALGLLSIERYLEIYGVKVESTDNETPLEELLHSKVMFKVNEDYTERTYFRTSSEKVRRSYLLEYANDKNDQQKHFAVPILIPERTSGSSFHPERTCMHKCSSCHGKFGLLDTPCHIAQIKNPVKQKACLENVTHLIGPVSCLCAACFRAIEKRSSKKYLPKNVCIVMTCKRNASHIFKSPWMEKIKCMLIKNGVMFRTWANNLDSIPICNVHHNQVLNVTQCQLCGNRTVQKFEVNKSETHEFQLVLNEDQIPYTIKYELLICKACRVYFLWRTHKETNIKDQQIDFVKHRDTIIRRICKHNLFELPLNLEEKKDIKPVENQIDIKIQEMDYMNTIPPSKPIENETIFNDIINDCTVNSSPTLQSTEIEASTTAALRVSEEASDSEIISTTVLEVVTNKLPPPMLLSSEVINVNLQPKLRKIGYSNIRPPNLKKSFTSPSQTLMVCKPSVVPILSQSVISALPTILPVSKPIPIPHSLINSKIRLNRKRSKVLQVAHVTRETANLFNELLTPYASSAELINRLLLLEKFRRLGDLVLAKHVNSKTKQQNLMTTTIGISKPLYRFPEYEPNKQTLLYSDIDLIENVSGTLCRNFDINKMDNKNDDYEGCLLEKSIMMIDCALINEDKEIPSNQNLTFFPTTTTTKKFLKIPKSIITKPVICKLTQSYNNIINVNGNGVRGKRKVNITPTTHLATAFSPNPIISTNMAATTISITNKVGISTKSITTTTVTNCSTISTIFNASLTTTNKATVNNTITNTAVTATKINSAAKIFINHSTALSMQNKISIIVTTAIIGNHHNSPITTTTTPTSIDNKTNPITSVKFISNKDNMVKAMYANNRTVNVTTKPIEHTIKIRNITSFSTPSNAIKLASIKPLLSSSTSNTVENISTLCIPKTVRLVNSKQFNSEEAPFTMVNGTYGK